jgi:glyoxylase-like metal-dependent hydrolase (beta-lactamase superfamily II)
MHAFSRRSFLTQTSCFGAAAALTKFFPSPVMAEKIAQDPRVAATPLLDKGFAATRRIGDGVYATIADPSKGFEALCNGGFIVGHDAALLIEGHHTPAGAAHELEALRMVSQAPVRAALDTHYHFDHTFGNAFYGAQRIPIYGHVKCAGLMVERYGSIQSGGGPALLAGFEKAAQNAQSDVDKQRALDDLQAATTLVNSAKAAALTLPNQPLEPAKLPMTMDLGGVNAIIETYPGHTPTDLIVRVPEQNIVFTGDLLFNGSYPVAFDGNMNGWIKTLDSFSRWGRDALFVPGHGAVCGQDGIVNERAILEELGNFAQKMMKAGVPVEEAQRRYTPSERFVKTPYFSWTFCIASAIANSYAEAKR